MAEITLSVEQRRHNGRMSRDTIIAIFQAAQAGEDQKEVAARFGASQQTVSDIFMGRRNSKITGASLSEARQKLADFAALSVVDRILHWSMPEPNSGCWLWLGGMTPSYDGREPRGYMRMVCDDGVARVRAASKCSYEAFKGPVPDGISVCHTCDFPPCVNPEHLFLGTHQQNMTDMVTKGRHAWGTRKKSAKLTEDNVHTIRARILDGAVFKIIADEFNVSDATVSAIACGKRWANLPVRSPVQA